MSRRLRCSRFLKILGNFFVKNLGFFCNFAEDFGVICPHDDNY